MILYDRRLYFFFFKCPAFVLCPPFTLMTCKRNRRNIGCYITHYFIISSEVSQKRQMWPVIGLRMIGVALKELNSSFRMQISSMCMI